MTLDSMAAVKKSPAIPKLEVNSASFLPGELSAGESAGDSYSHSKKLYFNIVCNLFIFYTLTGLTPLRPENKARR